LRRRLFRETKHEAPGSLECYYEELFLDGPLADAHFSSYVAVSPSEEIVGFVGVIPREMRLGGQPLRMAVATELMVDPDHRGLVAFDLLRRQFAGPQDFTYSDVATPRARRVWEAMRGEAALLYSLDWSRALRPWRQAANKLTSGTIGRAARGLFRPLLEFADARLIQSQNANVGIRRPDSVRIRSLEFSALQDGIERLGSKRVLRPHYSECQFRWLIDHLEQKNLGSLRCRLAETTGGRFVGWFIYYANVGGTGQVVQIISDKENVGLVLDAMFFDAWEAGTVELVGRADPAFLSEYSARGCNFYAAPASVLVHSRNPELLDVVRLGHALLTRMEGEWWLNF
jgi:hypothetical protein